MDEIIEFLWEYEWETEVYFERENDKKVSVSEILFADGESTAAKISLALSLQISGLQKSGDLIFDTVYNLRTGSLSFQTEGCDYKLNIDDIEDLYLECWSSADKYAQIQSDIESELGNENLVKPQRELPLRDGCSSRRERRESCEESAQRTSTALVSTERTYGEEYHPRQLMKRPTPLASTMKNPTV